MICFVVGVLREYWAIVAKQLAGSHKESVEGHQRGRRQAAGREKAVVEWSGWFGEGRRWADMGGPR